MPDKENGYMGWRLAAAVGLVLSLAAGAWAAPVTLQAQALETTPGVIAVDAQNVTTVQFCDPVSWSAYKASWLHVQVASQDKRVMLLDASATAGEAAMAVWVEGEGVPLQFIVRVSSTALANHVYYISCAHRQAGTAGVQPSGGASNRSNPPVATQVGPSAGAPPGSAAPAAPAPAHPRAPTTPGTGQDTTARPPGATDWDRFVSELTGAQWDLLKTLIANPTPEAYQAFTATLRPEQASRWPAFAEAAHLAPGRPSPSPPQEGGNAVRDGLPSWLAWEAHAQATETGTLVSYTVTNTGHREVVLDPARLRVLDARGAPIPGVEISRQDTSGFAGRVSAGDGESGVIRLPVAIPGGVTISWLIVEIGTGVTYLLTARVGA